MHYKNTQNLQHHLWMRESNLNIKCRHPIQNFVYHERNFYKSIIPRLTIQNVYKPRGYVSKFTPDGKLLLLFSSDQKTLLVYEYMGVAHALDLVSQIETECIGAQDESELSQKIRREIFQRLFKTKYIIPVLPFTSTRHYLSRDFCLFLDNGKFVLVLCIAPSISFPSHIEFLNFPDLFDHAQLHQYTFHLIDLKTGSITDSFNIENDFILIAHNTSIVLYGHILAILLSCRQCILLYELNVKLKKLQLLATIGPFGNDLDRERVLAHELSYNYIVNPSYSLPFSILKQKVMSFLYRKLIDNIIPEERSHRIKEFYRNFKQIEDMIILKIQLMNSDTLLLRFEERPAGISQGATQEDVFSSENAGLQNRIFVFYNITEQEVLNIFSHDSAELMYIYRNYCDEFRNARPLKMPWPPSSTSNNEYCRRIFDLAIQTYTRGHPAAASRINSSMPVSCQSFEMSPYLDYNIYNYDEGLLSALIRPRMNISEPIRFYERITGIKKFQSFLVDGSQLIVCTHESLRNKNYMVSYIFHPYEPFFMSLQKIVYASRYAMNFHIYTSSKFQMQ